MPTSKNTIDLYYSLCCSSKSDMDIGRNDCCVQDCLVSGHNGEPSDPGKNKLLEKILSLETLKEKTFQQLRAKDEEIAWLREQLGDETHLQERISTDREWIMINTFIQSLQTETEDIKDKLVTTATECQKLENRVAGKQDFNLGRNMLTTTLTALQSQLRDALEKNQQWLAYDQQREDYVKATLARIAWLEQNQANQALAQKHNETHSTEREEVVQMQDHYDRLLLKAKNELEALRERLDTAHRDLNGMQWKCEEKQTKVDELTQQLQAERVQSCNFKEAMYCYMKKENIQKAEVKQLHVQVDDERQRSAKLLAQVNLLQNLQLTHHEEQGKIEVLEQQVQISSKDLEDEKQNCLYLQKQLHDVLKKLCKANDQVAKLSEKEQRDATSYSDRVPPPNPPKKSGTLSPHKSNLLDDSILECPECLAQYPSSQYRELLDHLEHCVH